jgi:hypothetical protein
MPVTGTLRLSATFVVAPSGASAPDIDSWLPHEVPYGTTTNSRPPKAGRVARQKDAGPPLAGGNLLLDGNEAGVGHKLLACLRITEMYVFVNGCSFLRSAVGIHIQIAGDGI